MKIRYLETKSAISTFYWEYVIILNLYTGKIASNYMGEKKKERSIIIIGKFILNY